MKSLLVQEDREALLQRLAALQPSSIRQWGKMEPAQMLCHCAVVLETATGDRPLPQKLLGKIITPLIRSRVLGEKPFSRSGPTDPRFVVSEMREFDAERDRLASLVRRFVQNGPEFAGRQTHAFFGRLSGEEWGALMYKHIDHHLRQFGA